MLLLREPGLRDEAPEELAGGQEESQVTPLCRAPVPWTQRGGENENSEQIVHLPQFHLEFFHQPLDPETGVCDGKTYSVAWT